MSMEQTLVADGDRDDYIREGITDAEVHANLGNLDTLRVTPGSRASQEANMSFVELTRSQQAPVLGWLALQRPRTVIIENN